MNRLIIGCLALLITGCASYPEFLDKKLTTTETEYRPDGTIFRIIETEHTPSTLAQASISSGSAGKAIEGCVFDITALSEGGEIAFAVGQAAGKQMNPCLNGSALAGNETNMFDRDIAEASAQSSITGDLIGATVVGYGIKTAGKVLDSAFDVAGDEYTVGDINQSTSYASAGGSGGDGGIGGEALNDDAVGGAGGEGAAAGAAGGGTNGNNSLNIGRANANGTAGADALTATAPKSGNGSIEDGDGVINRGTDESDNNVNAAVDVTIPVGVNGQ